MSPISAREEGVIPALGNVERMQGEQARRGFGAWQGRTGGRSRFQLLLHPDYPTLWLETHPKSISISSSNVRAEGPRLTPTSAREPGTALLPPTAGCLWALLSFQTWDVLSLAAPQELLLLRAKAVQTTEKQQQV